MGQAKKIVKCQNCGASDFTTVNGYRTCSYCGSVLSSTVESTIALNSDVQNLLNKMQTDPANAVLYANLILDIDPTNVEIQKYLY
ncbi:TFIIB-type zinc finger domain-containing protein [Companilactobacillus versmoldensis]|uniref:Uncharacterized protein n=1 Tax=Companilactobacillus versmoldensis DSM 14857 = KCTC 3814 TaxID=1423815 RepID=A0A0R1SJ29_9LACO|nr:TFIIB-type zinc finger domain-containing protein [Companilactobacillus versmoldensis]KRL65907.1 hypothetical protein FC27_GL001199 [Companilactobacillus versmoldensis DSM 14857 = KCTC 3814]